MQDHLLHAPLRTCILVSFLQMLNHGQVPSSLYVRTRLTCLLCAPCALFTSGGGDVCHRNCTGAVALAAVLLLGPTSAAFTLPECLLGPEPLEVSMECSAGEDPDVQGGHSSCHFLGCCGLWPRVERAVEAAVEPHRCQQGWVLPLLCHLLPLHWQQVAVSHVSNGDSGRWSSPAPESAPQAWALLKGCILLILCWHLVGTQ